MTALGIIVAAFGVWLLQHQYGVTRFEDAAPWNSLWIVLASVGAIVLGAYMIAVGLR